MKKNFLIYVEDPRFGGPHQYTINILNELKKNFDVKFIISNQENKIFLNKLNSKKVSIKILPLSFLSFKLSKILSYIFFFIYEIFLIRDNIKKSKSDIIYSISGLYSFKLIVSALFLKKKIVVHFHDAYCNKFFVFLSFFTKNFIDLAVYSSKKSFSFYNKYIERKNYLITPSSINIKKFKRKMKKKKNFFDLITVANINPVKNLELLIMIAATLKSIKNIRFHIIGKVWQSQIKYNQKITQLIKNKKLNNIYFYDLIDKDKIKKKLINSDVYICTSKNESSPMAIWEAMSCYLPIISTDVGDLNKFNRKYNFGIIIKNKSASNFKKSIFYFYKDKKLSVKYGNKSAFCVYNEMNVKNSYKKFEKKLIRL